MPRRDRSSSEAFADGLPSGTVTRMSSGTRPDVGVNVPTGIPLVYELDRDLVPISSRYLASEAEVAAAQHAVASQGKAKH